MNRVNDLWFRNQKSKMNAKTGVVFWVALGLTATSLLGCQTSNKRQSEHTVLSSSDSGSFLQFARSQTAAIEAKLRQQHRSATLDWHTLKCAAKFSGAGVCVVHGDINTGPNTSTVFSITISRPEFADCNYEDMQIDIVEITGEC